MPVAGLIGDPAGSVTLKMMLGLGWALVAPPNPWTVRPREGQVAGSG